MSMGTMGQWRSFCSKEEKYPVPQPASSARPIFRPARYGSSMRNRIVRMPRYHQKSLSLLAMLANSAGFMKPLMGRTRLHCRLAYLWVDEPFVTHRARAAQLRWSIDPAGGRLTPARLNESGPDALALRSVLLHPRGAAR